MDVAVGCSHRLHSGEFLNIFGSNTVDSLGDQHQADAKPKDSRDRQCAPGTSLNQPKIS